MVRRATLAVVLLLLLAAAAPAAAQVPDLSGIWSITSQLELPDNGGTCNFKGYANVQQDGIQLSGQVVLTLVSGPMGCPPTMMATLDGEADGQGCAQMGALMGPLGGAFFDGCPGEAVHSLVGNIGVETGPYGGGGGSWSAVFVGQDVLAIPTLGALGLAALITLLLVSGAWILRRRLI